MNHLAISLAGILAVAFVVAVREAFEGRRFGDKRRTARFAAATALVAVLGVATIWAGLRYPGAAFAWPGPGGDGRGFGPGWRCAESLKIEL
jgi:hypothetical protein